MKLFTEKQLFQFRKKTYHEFGKVAPFHDHLTKLINSNVDFPLIYGHSDFPYSEWDSLNLLPQDQNTELTVRNYLAGIEKLAHFEKEGKNYFDNRFHAAIVHEGLNTRHRSNKGERIFLAAFDVGRPCFNLEIFWMGKEYLARAFEEPGIVCKTMQPHMGPNREVY